MKRAQERGIGPNVKLSDPERAVDKERSDQLPEADGATPNSPAARGSVQRLVRSYLFGELPYDDIVMVNGVNKKPTTEQFEKINAAMCDESYGQRLLRGDYQTNIAFELVNQERKDRS